MATNKKLLDKGIKSMFYALPLMFVGPSIIHNAWINKQNVWHYLVLGFGILFCVLAVYFMFRGIKLITDSMFNHDQ